MNQTPRATSAFSFGLDLYAQLHAQHGETQLTASVTCLTTELTLFHSEPINVLITASLPCPNPLKINSISCGGGATSFFLIPPGPTVGLISSATFPNILKLASTAASYVPLDAPLNPADPLETQATTSCGQLPPASAPAGTSLRERVRIVLFRVEWTASL